MKKYPLLTLLLFISIISSCSDDDSTVEVENTDYFPLSIDNSWSYDNAIDQNNSTFEGSEVLTINNSTQNKFTFTQEVNDIAGIFTSVLESGEAYKTDGNRRLVFDGLLSISIGDNLPDVEFPLEDVVLYNSTLSQNELMSTSSGEFQQSINGFPVNFNYEVNSILEGFSAEETVNNTTFEDVIKTTTEVNLSASVFLVFSNFPIIQEQKVVTISNYYAKDVGLIYSDTTIEIIFEDAPPQLEIELTDFNLTSTQRINDYSL